MVQYALDWTLSLGVHIDPLHRQGDKGAYGPYLDIHLVCLAISLGYHPARAWNDSLMRPERY